MTNLLPLPDRLLLTAATRLDDVGLAAFRRWRDSVPLDRASGSAYVAMPRLVELAKRHGIDDPDIERMRGVGRHVWTSNMLLLKALFAAVSALEGAGIRPLMLKSAALMARDAGVAQKQRASDYDVLILPSQLPEAAAALKAAGLKPSGGFDWNNIDGQMDERIAGAMEIQLEGTRSGIDLHWQPIWSIHDPALAQLVIEGAEAGQMQGHPVLVPQPAHQVFLALARCEPWDADECFRRLLEGYQVLAMAGPDMDWEALLALVRRYRLEATAAAYLETLRETTDAAIPDSVLAALRPDAAQAAEWRVRGKPPELRSSVERRLITRQDIAAGRAKQGTTAPGWLEATIREFWTIRPPLRLLRWLALRRHQGPSTGRPRFLEGFWYPEAEGRWTQRGWAVVAVPGADGGVVTLDADLFVGHRKQVRVGVAGGGRPLFATVTQNDMPIRLRVTPEPRLGGDGLLLLWLPDAPSPSEAGSTDKRQLGLFLRYGWRR